MTALETKVVKSRHSFSVGPSDLLCTVLLIRVPPNCAKAVDVRQTGARTSAERSQAGSGDRRIRFSPSSPAIAAKAPNADSTHIAVLACLHLADRMRSLEQELNRLKSHVDRKSEEYAGMLERLLAGAGEEI